MLMWFLTRSGEWGVGSGECGVGSAELGVWSVECGVGSCVLEFKKLTLVLAFSR
ncbi:MAG: hypothetical protein PHZ24_12695 [Bacteroidales bacterium]|nr:hypothetical protein [Bacteroidales bacterium]